MNPQTIGGVTYGTEDTGGAGNADSAPNIPATTEGFFLSRITTEPVAGTEEGVIDPISVHRELSETGIEVVAFTEEEDEKFGIKDHPLHKAHLATHAMKV